MPITKNFVCAVIALFVAGIATTSTAQQPNAGSVQASQTIAGGLKTSTFLLHAGKIDVNFPDDMAASDQISGTVVTQPAGKTPEERQENQDELQGYVVDIKPAQPPSQLPGALANLGSQLAQVPLSKGASCGGVPSFSCQVPPSCTGMNVGLQQGSATVCSSAMSCLPTPPPMPCADGMCIMPKVGRGGYPLSIKRRCKGGFSNSQVQMQGPGCAPVLLTPLAKSPRQLVVKSPRSIVGPAVLTAREGNQMSTGNFNNLKLVLTCPNNVLHKGESTQVQVAVLGMGGMKEAVKLHIQAAGVIDLSGGNDQTFILGGGHH